MNLNEQSGIRKLTESLENYLTALYQQFLKDPPFLAAGVIADS